MNVAARIAVVSLFVASVSCADCGGGNGNNGSDTGVGMASDVGPDAAADMPAPDLGTADMRAGDMGMADLATPDADMGGVSFEGIHWVSTNGPPGGQTDYFMQDPHHPDEVYVGTVRGLFRSTNDGDDWSLFFEGGVGRMAFDATRRYLCNPEGIWVYDGAWTQQAVGPPCDRLTLDGTSLYATNSWEPGPPPVDLEIMRAATGQLDSWEDVSPSAAQLQTMVGTGEPPNIFTTRSLLADGQDLLAVIGGIDPWPGDTLFRSTDGGATWMTVDVGARPDFIVWRVVADPDDPAHVVALVRSPTTDYLGPVVPLNDTIMESIDHGATWGPATTVSNIAVPDGAIPDVDFYNGDLLLTNVDKRNVILHGPDFDTATELPMPNVPAYAFAYEIDNAAVDVRNNGTVWGRGHLGWDGIVRSDDDLATWTRTVNGIVASAAPNLTTHPTDPDVMVAAGNLGYLPHITRDRGTTWQPLVGTPQMADEAAFNPHDPSQLLVVSEASAIMESTDDGQSFHSLAAEFSANRVMDIEMSPDGNGRLYVSNMGVNIGLAAPADWPTPTSQEWQNMLSSPDYAYDIEIDPTDSARLLATYSPKVFEDFASVYRYDETQAQNDGWTEVLHVPGASGTTSLAFDTLDPTSVYAASTGRNPAIHVSRDRGETWSVLQPGANLTFSTVHVLAVDPTDEDHVLAAPWGAGLFRSRDGGMSWQQVVAPTRSVSAILFDDADPGHILLGDRTRPVVWETLDDGANWSELVSLDPSVYYRIMALTRFDGEVYVSVMNLPQAAPFVPSGAVFRAGPPAVQVPGALGRSALAFDASATALYAVGHMYGVYELLGGQFYDISGDLPDMGFNDILVENGGELSVAGGSDIGLDLQPRIGDATIVNDIYRTADDGTSWDGLLGDNRFSGPIKVLEQHPTNSQLLVAGTAHGVWTSPDDGQSWVQQTGLGFGAVGSMTVTQDFVYVGTLGGGVYRGRFDAQWDIDWDVSHGPQPKIYNVQVDVDPTDSNVLYVSAYPGGVFKSTDGGASWAESNFALPSFEVSDPTLQGYYALEIDPNDSDVLYLGIHGHGVYKSVDGATTWTPMFDPAIAGKPVREIALDPAQPGRVYLATRDGVFTSSDGAVSWQVMDAGLPTPDALTIEVADGRIFLGTAGYGAFEWDDSAGSWVHLGQSRGIGVWNVWGRRLYQYTALLFANDDPDTIFLGNFPGGFFTSYDRGQSWKSQSLGLGNDGMFSLTAHPTDPDVLFAGTYNGIVRSDDRGRSWRAFGTGYPAEQWPFAVVIDPTRAERMYMTTKNGANQGFCERNAFCGVLMRSDDGGESWTPIMNGMDDQREYYMLVIDPADPDVLFVSTSRGVYASADGGDSWVPINDGLPTTELRVRDNVAQNLKLAADGRTLFLGIVDYGVWMADLSVLGLP